jgi:hypothetical protein
MRACGREGFLKRSKIVVSDLSEIMEAAGGGSYEELRSLLDHVCSEIATRFGLYNTNNHPRKATIIDVIANSTCVSCSARRLSNNPPWQQIDGIYIECHRLAVGTLIEELHDKLGKMGYSVMILSEAETEYGKVDVLIKPTNYGVRLNYGLNDLIVEVKTGLSMSFSQIFRYMLDKEGQTLILWRIRNRQVLVFDGNQFKPILMRFMKNCILRGERLLKTEKADCKHPTKSNCWIPDQRTLQEMLEDFTGALLETLPCVTKTIFRALKVKENSTQS